MKRRAMIGIAVLGVIAAGSVGFGPGTAQAQRPPAGTLELVSRDRETSFSFVDNPPRRGERRPTAGDIGIIRGRLRNASGRRRVGQVHAVFTVLRGRPFTAHVSATFYMRRGDIAVAGRIDDVGRTDEVPIIGGTDAFAGARGTLEVTSRRTDSRFVFRFAP
jgi:hypothetical protein